MRSTGSRYLVLAVVLFALMAAAAAPAAATTTGGGHWTWRSPLPHGASVSSASFVSPAEGWLATSGGGVLHTQDGGQTWERQETGEPYMLTKVCFVNTSSGWAVGDAGAILHTGDGGATWERQASMSLDWLTDVEFVDDLHGWVLGSGGAIFATTDGGVTWSSRTRSFPLADWWFNREFTDMVFADDLHGWAVGGEWLPQQGSQALVLATSDGGLTWSETRVPSVDGLTCITLHDGTLWAVGPENAVLCSADGGATWTRKTVVAPRQLWGVAFSGTGQGFAVGSSFDDWEGSEVPVVITTEDGGETWDAVDIDGVDASPVSVWFDGLDGGIVTYTGGMVASTDGGATWSASAAPGGRGLTFSDVAISPEGDIWAVGGADGPEGLQTAGIVRVSRDGGSTWTTIEEPVVTAAPLTSVVALAGGQVWAAGHRGQVVHSADGGATWAKQATGIACDLRVAFADSQRGWAVGSGLGGTVLKTTDGGQHWRFVHVRDNVHFVDVSATGVDVWLGGARGSWSSGYGILEHSADDGSTWADGGLSDIPGITRLVFFDGGPGWVLAGHEWYEGSSKLFHTTDAGSTWGEQATQVIGYLDEGWLTDLAFSDAQHGWAVGGSWYDQGVLLRTVDGGAHWGLQRLDLDSSLMAVAFKGEGTGCIAGTGASLLTTGDGGGSAPVTIANAGRRSGVVWTRRPFPLALTAIDDGFGIGRTESKLDSAAWEDLSIRQIDAPRTHANDGVHVVLYRSEDAAGNREATQTCAVIVDTRRPTVKAPYQATVRRGRTARIRLVAQDRLSPAVRTLMTIRNRAGKVVARTKRTIPTSGTSTFRFFCRLPVGSYRFTVTVTDPAGNPGLRSASNVLRVKRG